MLGPLKERSHWGASSRPPQPEEVRPSQGLLGSAGECGRVLFCHPVPLPLLCFCHPPPLLPTLTQPVPSPPTQLTLLFPSTGPDHSRHNSRRLGPTLKTLCCKSEGRAGQQGTRFPSMTWGPLSRASKLSDPLPAAVSRAADLASASTPISFPPLAHQPTTPCAFTLLQERTNLAPSAGHRLVLGHPAGCF